MKLLLPIFLISLLSLKGLKVGAYVQDTIIKNTNAVAPEYKVNFVINGDNPSTNFKPNATTGDQASSSNTSAGGTISFPNGKKQEVAETPTSIEDKEGKIYAVGEDGKVTKAAEKTKETQNLAGNMSTREKTTSEGTVSFSAYKEQSYAFDAYQDIYESAGEYKNKYEEFGGEQVAVKAIASGKPDRVSIAFDGGMPIDSIYFLTPTGVRYKAERDNGGYYLNLIGGEANAVQEIYAILPNRQDTTKPMTIGKLIVAAYPRQEKNLILVPVNGAKVDTAGVVKKINEIYNPVNVYWTIKIAENFNNTSWDTDKDGALNVTGSKWYTTYTEEMKALKTAYSQTNNIDQRTLYMFVMKKAKTDDETSSKTIVGDMPRGKQFGFLFTEGTTQATLGKTIAHELGHGYFQLKHPFEMGLNKEQLPDNLMDYAGGTTFNKYEWDLMHDPGIVTGLFESDTSGQMSKEFTCIIENYYVYLGDLKNLILNEVDKNQLVENKLVEKNYWIPAFDKNRVDILNKTNEMTLDFNKWVSNRKDNNIVSCQKDNELYRLVKYNGKQYWIYSQITQLTNVANLTNAESDFHYYVGKSEKGYIQWNSFKPVGYNPNEILNNYKLLGESASILEKFFGGTVVVLLAPVIAPEIIPLISTEYLTHRTIDAAIDVAAQLTVNKFDVDKIDWADVATNYIIPKIKGGLKGKALEIMLKNAINSGIDYTNEKGLRIVGNNKSIQETTKNFIIGSVCDGVFKSLNAEITKQISKNLKDTDKVTKITLQITEKQREYVQETLKNALTNENE